MNKALTKYLSITVLLLLISVTSVFANSLVNSNLYLINVKTPETSQTTFVKSSTDTFYFTIAQNKEAELFFDYTEIEESENEESTSTVVTKSLYNYLKTYLTTHSLRGLSYLLDKETKKHKPQPCQTNTKTHIRLQVFII